MVAHYGTVPTVFPRLVALMAITQTASRVRIESAAKNGTLSTQGALNDDQIKFDTNISTNNSNLEASPSFRRRHVCLRAGEADEEINMVQSIDVDGVTCTMYEDWAANPASGDTYDVAYRLEDLATIAGCDFETDSRQYNMTKRLVIGTATVDGFLGISHGQILRANDEGPTTTAIRINAKGVFTIGTIKNSRGERGGGIVFTNDADDETVMDFASGAKGRFYEFCLTAARGHEGVTGLAVTVNAAADMDWGRAQLHGMNAPFTKRVSNITDITATQIDTVAGVKTMAFWNGWCKSENDESFVDALVGEAATNRVLILIEDT